MNENYTAIILAAGKGTRLRPLTNEKPKCMVPVGGKPMLERQLDLLTRCGIKDIIVVTGYLEEKISDHRITKVHNPDFDTTNMIYSLFCAEEYLRGNIIVAYGDIIYSEEVLKKLMQSKKDMVIASDQEWLQYWQRRFDDPLSDAESFVKGPDERVRSVGQVPGSKDDIEGQFIGLIKFSEKGCQKLKQAYKQCENSDTCAVNAWDSSRSLRNAYMTDILNHFAREGALNYIPIRRGWFEVDDTKDLEIANNRINKELAIKKG